MNIVLIASVLGVDPSLQNSTRLCERRKTNPKQRRRLENGKGGNKADIQWGKKAKGEDTYWKFHCPSDGAVSHSLYMPHRNETWGWSLTAKQATKRKKQEQGQGPEKRTEARARSNPGLIQQEAERFKTIKYEEKLRKSGKTKGKGEARDSR